MKAPLARRAVPGGASSDLALLQRISMGYGSQIGRWTGATASA
jgi:hypothetical protein